MVLGMLRDGQCTITAAIFDTANPPNGIQFERPQSRGDCAFQLHLACR